jgi:hypothetical protein
MKSRAGHLLKPESYLSFAECLGRVTMSLVFTEKSLIIPEHFNHIIIEVFLERNCFFREFLIVSGLEYIVEQEGIHLSMGSACYDTDHMSLM